MAAFIAVAAIATLGRTPTAADASTEESGRLAPAAAAAAVDPDCHEIPAGPESGLPPMLCVPGNPSQKVTNNWVLRDGIDFDHIQATVNKAKIRLSLPPQALLTDLQLCTRIGNVWARGTPCPMADDRGYQIPSFPGVVFVGGYADAWVKSPPEAATEFGVFPPVQVRTVAFGTIPVTATVHLEQTMHNGMRDPLKFDWLQAAARVPDGTDIPGYGPPPHLDNPTVDDNHFAYPAETSGPVTIRLSDVQVDGESLPVGNECSTGATTLNLAAPGGYYNETDQTNNRIPPGKPGAFDPVTTPPTYLSGSIDIPAFRNCGAGTDDLSALITAMVSGPDNPITAENKSEPYFWCVGVITGHDTGPQPGSFCPPTESTASQSSLLPRVTSKSVDADALAMIPKDIINRMTAEDKKLVAAALQGKPLGQ